MVEESLVSKKLFSAVVGFTVCSITLLTSVRLGFTLSHGFGVNFISGAWLSLSRDLQHGVFYRPVFSPEMGFGGTRYFPLYFMILALFSSLIKAPVLSCCVLSLVSICLLVVGTYKFLRDIGLDLVISYFLSFLPLLTLSSQSGIDTVRCDILCTALNVWGLMFFLRWQAGKSSIIPCVVFFVLAFSVKMTGIFGSMSAVAYLTFKSPRRALLLGSSLTSGFVVCLGAMYLGSRGRILEILAICATGGVTPLSILRSPWTLLSTMAYNDLTSFMLVFLAIMYGAPRLIVEKLSIANICFIVVVLLLVLIFASPGVWINHFLDLVLVSVILLAYGLGRIRQNLMDDYLAALATIAIVGIVILTRVVFVNDIHRQSLDDARAVLAYVGSGEKSLIAEDPLIPILANEVVYVPEPYMLRLINERMPVLKQRLLLDIEQRQFRAIIFIKDPVSETEWYSNIHFGIDFVDSVLKNYELGRRIGNYFVYLPRNVP